MCIISGNVSIVLAVEVSIIAVAIFKRYNSKVTDVQEAAPVWWHWSPVWVGMSAGSVQSVNIHTTSQLHQTSQ